MTTLYEMKEQIKSDLEMREEQYLPDSDIVKLINDAVSDAHKHIVRVYEDYFLSFYSQELLANQSVLTLPTDIFADKIRAMIFRDGPIGSASITCEFSKVKSLRDAMNIRNIITDNTGAMRLWLLTDQAVASRGVKLIPETGKAGFVDMWYVRKPALLVNDSDVCPIPEFADYVVQRAKVAYYRNDGDPRYQVEKAELLELQEQMTMTLSNRTLGEDDNVIKRDVSFYEDSI